MTEEQNAGKIFLFCKEPSPEQIMKCLRDAFDVPGSVHDADLKLHNGDLDGNTVGSFSVSSKFGIKSTVSL